MAKKINFKSESETMRAVGVLKDFHIEHVLVQYVNEERTTLYVVVRNCLKTKALAAFHEANISPKRIKNQRHYEQVTKNHKLYLPKK